MMLWVRNVLALSVVALAATACGMDGSRETALPQNSQWFEYAYYSSEATLEADGMNKEVLDYNKARMRIY